MKDTIAEKCALADYDLAKVMGYGHPDDYPKWSRQTAYTKEDIAKENSQRYLYKSGRITKSELARFMGVLDARSRAGYEFTHPRRPMHWSAVLDAYVSISESKKPTTKQQVQRLIEETHPDTVRERKAEDKRREQARKEAKRVRNLPQNKNQRWNSKEKRDYAETDDVDSRGESGMIFAARKPRTLTESQYNPESVLNKLVGLLYTGPRHVFQNALRKQVSSEVQEQRLKTSLEGANQNSSEFSEGGYGNSYIPPPGKKASGKFRWLWGSK